MLVGAKTTGPTTLLVPLVAPFLPRQLGCAPTRFGPLEQAAEATRASARAARIIAESLLIGIQLQRKGLSGSRIGRENLDV